MGYYSIKFKIRIPKNVIKERMDKKDGLVQFEPMGYVYEVIIEEDNPLLCYEKVIELVKKKIKYWMVTVSDEKEFNKSVANVKCLKYMHNAKKGDKFDAIPLYFLLDENNELQFEIKKTTKDKYDKFIATKEKELKKCNEKIIKLENKKKNFKKL